MNSKIVFNIISATIDPTSQILNFINAIQEAHQTHSDCIELNLILIDQFKEDRSNLFQTKFSNIIYIHSKKTGLSLNRNIGISLIKSNIYTFLDSDCTIESDYFKIFLEIYKNNKNDCMIYGSIKSAENKSINVFKKWPKSSKSFNIFEKWIYSTSVNIIYIGAPIYFDEKFGLGTYFGSCEDIDYALRFKKKPIFNSNLYIYHPYQNFDGISFEKILSYSRGYGALCKKHLSVISFSFLAISIFYKIITTKPKNIKKTLLSIQGRLQGFLKF